ncbi:unnamed protein product [Brassicogethes aeneus]|uniref:Nose resistant-to-fluoxetine protein N-terminal domain-containing protein n=1 Tax=Brassicogethes aeneus TaxID=1431903 RepID=A0A9P0FM88_BRAAE|nr:unnamed protein product [Brassicogethes aeneus]
MRLIIFVLLFSFQDGSSQLFERIFKNITADKLNLVKTWAEENGLRDLKPFANVEFIQNLTQKYNTSVPLETFIKDALKKYKTKESPTTTEQIQKTNFESSTPSKIEQYLLPIPSSKKVNTEKTDEENLYDTMEELQKRIIYVMKIIPQWVTKQNIQLLMFLPQLSAFRPLLQQILPMVDHFVLSKENMAKIEKTLNLVVKEVRVNQCIQDLYTLSRLDDSLLNMIDAWAKPQAGILNGNLYHMGNFDQCLNITGKISGKYCTIPIDIDFKKIDSLTLKPSYGVCLPSTCSSNNVQIILNGVNMILGLQRGLQINDDMCYTKESVNRLSYENLTAIYVFLLFFLLITISTLYDLWSSEANKSFGCQILVAFSLYTNGKKLFSTKVHQETLGCLNGIRVISMFWIVLTHTCIYFCQYFPMITKWNATIILGGSLAVDTFFAVSGLLVVYLYMYTKEHDQINLFRFYLHRFLRLTPSLIMVIFLSACLFKTFATGPYWNDTVTSKFEKNCRNNWWYNLLYLQTYIKPEDCCLNHTWFLAVNMQLYVLAPILIYFLTLLPKCTLLVMSVGTIASCIYSASLTWQNKYLHVTLDNTTDQKFSVFIPTYIRGNAWLVGAMFGYIIFRKRNQQVYIHRVLGIFLVVFSISALLGIIASHQRLAAGFFDQSDSQNKYIYSTLYNGFVRPVWCLFVCTLIFLCVNGYGGIINRILSAPSFNFLIKLNYAMYLTHPLVMFYFYAQRRNPFYVTEVFMVQYLCTNFVVTFLVSILWTLAFESPVQALEKIRFRKEDKNVNYKL